MKLLIACPVQNREWILPEYLHYVHNLDYNKKDITLYWIINNSTDGSKGILELFKEGHKDEYADIIIEEYNNSKYAADARNKKQRRGSTYFWLAELRNKILDKGKDFDYTLSSDCDILLRYDTLTQLLSHKEDAVSALVYNGHKVNRKEPWRFPNILRYSPAHKNYHHIVNKWVKEPWLAPKGKTIPVDFTGACILISNKACHKSRYDYYIKGEDEPFSKGVKKFGNLLCDVSLLNIHIMDKDMLLHINDNTERYLCGGWR